MAHYRSRLLLTAFCLVAGWCALPCAGAAEDIGVITHGRSHGFFRGLEKGMKRAAEDLGVHLVVRALSERAMVDPPSDLHVQMLDFMLSQKVAAIVMVPETLKGISGPVSVPVPLVLVDRDGPQFTAQSVVSTDNFAAGRVAASHLAPLLPKGASVVVLRLRPDVTSTTQREEGFIAGAREMGWNVVAAPFVGTRFRESEGRIAEVLDPHQGRVDAVFASNESLAFGAVRAVAALPAESRPRLATVDWRPEFREALADGTLTFTVLQDNEAMGYRAVAAAVAASHGDTIPARVSIDVAVVSTANMNEPALRKMIMNYENP